MNKFKRKLRVAVAIAMMLIIGFSANAHDFEVDGIYYKIIPNKTGEVAVTFKNNNYGSYSTKEIVIPSNITYKNTKYVVTEIGKYAFLLSKNIKKITLPNTIIKIGEQAFNGCSSLINIIIPESVTLIEEYAFADCSSLKTIIIPNSVSLIGESVFSRCKNLTKVQFPMNKIPSRTFEMCYSLESIIVPYVITEIGDYAFSRCSLKGINFFSDQLKTIGSWAFQGCISLTGIYLPENLTTIGYWAFSYCDSLSIIFFNSKDAQFLNDDAFYTSVGSGKLETIIFGKNVESISTTSFGQSTINTIISLNSTPPTCVDNAFKKIDKTNPLYVPKGCYSTYWSSPIWSEFMNIIEIEKIIESISLPKSVNISLNSTFQLSPSITPLDATLKQLFWESSDPSIASVDQEGNITAISNGKATIIAKTIDGSDIWDSCEVHIGEINAESISLNLSDISICKGETQNISCIVLPEDASNKSVTWKSDNLEVAVVRVNDDSTATILAVNTGQTVITATTVDGSNLSATCKVTVIPTLATSISLDKTEISLEATQTTELTATVLPELTTDKSVIWSSSNNAVATVDANGLVTAISVGEATITAITADGSNLSATCKVIVEPTLAESIVLDNSEVTLKASETAELRVTILPELTTDKSVVWSTSDESVATVDANGLVTAISVGEADITATTVDGSNLSASCKVTVIPTLVESITLDKTEISLEATETATLVVNVLPELATNKALTWTSSDESVATVNTNGVVTAIAIGEAIITATTTDGSNLSVSCKVTVVPTLVESIALDKTEISLEATHTAELTATILPEMTTNKSVTWTSSNEAVAVVDENGLVTAISVGEATITATTADGSNLSATCKVTVIPTLATSITLDKTEISLEATQTTELTVTVLPELTTDKSVVWSTSDESVATVDANGLVTAISVGEATITAITTDGSNLSAICKVTVVPTLVISIEVTPTEVEVEERSEVQLSVVVLPEEATNKEVAWSSSNESVATVDNNGLVSIHKEGEATITARTTDGSNLSATCVIKAFSGIVEVESLNFYVKVVGDDIVVCNAPIGNQVAVYNTDGQMVAAKEVTDAATIFSAPIKGIYLVKVGKDTMKVFVK